MNTVVSAPMYGWDSAPWKKYQRSVWKLQKRIYQATLRGDTKKVRKLQRLLMNSHAAKLLAVRRVTQENTGKRTPGIDGVKALSKRQRIQLANHLTITDSAKPVRRVWIDKADSDEKRPLGIPVMEDRARQTLVKQALEPEWEARFEPNSYGFRPGRSCHDAIEAIFRSIGHKPKFALDADIAKCFDRIDHRALLAKVNASPRVQRQLKAWLKSGVMDGDHLFPSLEGVMQGGTISPLLANIALHGLETTIVHSYLRRKGVRSYPPTVVRYADDFVILHADRQVIEQCAEVARLWLRPLGLELKTSKTRIAHTLNKEDGTAGFDFLGFNIRQYPVGRTKSGTNGHGNPLGFKTFIKPSRKAIGKHVESLRRTIHSLRGAPQELVVFALNRIIRGWTRYYSTVVSGRVFGWLEHNLFRMLWAWAKRRHPKKGKHWCYRRYWGKDIEGRTVFRPPKHPPQLYKHGDTAIRRHVKVQGSRTPYDGDWIYWSTRRGHSPDAQPRVTKLLRRQQGRCIECKLFFRDGESLEVAYINSAAVRRKEASYNLMLLHHYCREQLGAEIARSKRCV